MGLNPRLLTPETKTARDATERLVTTLRGFLKSHARLPVGDFARALAVASTQVLTERAGADDYEAALVTGAGRRAALLDAEGGCIGAEAIGKLLGISKQAVHMRRRKGGLLAVATGRRDFAFPVWQVHDGRVLVGIPDVVEALLASFGKRQDEQTMRFFLGANPLLAGRTPLDLLRAGEVEAVLEAAATYGVHGG